MDQYIELLKLFAGILSVVIPAITLWFSQRTPRQRELEDRARRLQTFFHDGGVDLPPILMEATFGGALGHLKLNANEIPIVLRQKAPTQFLQKYLDVREYLEPSEDGSRLVLKSIAASSSGNLVFRWVALFFYSIFAMSAMWLLFEHIPVLVSKSSWMQAFGTLMLILLFAGMAWHFLIMARRVSWALQLYRTQTLGDIPVAN